MASHSPTALPVSTRPSRPSPPELVSTPSGHPREPVIVAMPPGDALFGRAVERVVERATGRVESSAAGVRRAQLDLRRVYPTADLHRQDAVVIRGRATDVWFAYRDGRRATPSDADAQAEGESLDGGERRPAARVVFDATGKVVARQGPVDGAQIPPTPGTRSALGPRSIQDILPTTTADVVGPRGLLARMGELRGSWAGARSGHAATPTVYRVLHEGAGPGRHVLELRPGGGVAEVARAALTRSALGASAAAHRDVLLGTARTRELKAGDRLTESLIDGDWTALVVSGLVRLHLVGNGSEPTIAYRTGGSIFRGDGHDGTVAPPLGLQAMTAANVLLLDSGLVRQASRSNSAVAEALTEEALRLLGDVLGLYATRTSSSLPRRLAGEILRLRACQSEATLVVVTEQQLADGIGSIRESVARAIATLRARGWLATTRHGLLVLDPQALERMANEAD
jgi:CRP/FNR family cyclic AMP-dependent transcriptional regulator